MKIDTTGLECELHVNRSGRKVSIVRITPTGQSRIRLSLTDARAVSDALHDVLEAQ